MSLYYVIISDKGDDASEGLNVGLYMCSEVD
jgi:hypothetical protein